MPLTSRYNAISYPRTALNESINAINKRPIPLVTERCPSLTEYVINKANNVETYETAPTKSKRIETNGVEGGQRCFGETKDTKHLHSLATLDLVRLLVFLRLSIEMKEETRSGIIHGGAASIQPAAAVPSNAPAGLSTAKGVPVGRQAKVKQDVE